MRKWILRIGLSVAVIAWMAVIFLLSAEDGDESSHTSDVVVDAVIGAAEGLHLVKPENVTAAVRDKVSFFVRKAGHATEYAILAVLIAGCLFAWGVSRRRVAFCVAWAAAAVYAMTDEYHQRSVAGRAGQWRDVLVDAAGAAAGVLILWLILCVIRRKNVVKSNKSDA